MDLLRIVVFIAAMAALLLPGCSPAEAVCRAADLVAPDLVAPENLAYLTDTTPWLTWEMKAVAYTSPSETVPCHPDSYRVSISTGPMYTDELGADVTPMEVTGGWTSPPLQSGKTYQWNVTAIRNGIEGPTSKTRTFSIGECTADQLPVPVLLSPADQAIVHTSRPTFEWSTTTTNCPSMRYVLAWHEEYRDVHCWFNGVHGDIVIAPDLSGTLDDLGTDLRDCTKYAWDVHACNDPLTMQSCTWSGEQPFTVMLPGTNECPPPAFSSCVEPTPTPPAPVGEKPWEVTANANCRVCPSGACNESGFAPKGYLAPIEGRNEDATWFRIKDPNGVSCWVWGGALNVLPDAGDRLLLSYPTPPTVEEPAQVQCSSFKNIRACIANPPCTWDRVRQACIGP